MAEAAIQKVLKWIEWIPTENTGVSPGAVPARHPLKFHTPYP